MTIWLPNIGQEKGPRYLAVVEALTSDVRAGRLRPGDRLPTHRDLAYRLGVTVGTITRAYAEAERRGLIGGEVGRGTFVRSDVRYHAAAHATKLATVTSAAATPGALIDFSVNLPPPMSNDTLLANAISDIAGRSGINRLLDYHPHAGLDTHRAAGARWLEMHGYPVEAERVIVTSGGQHAMTAAFGSITEPGDVVLTEALTYPGMRRLADFLRLKLRGVALDEDGIDPDAFETACRTLQPKALYCAVNFHNPTGTVSSLERRRAIASIAQRYGIKIVEDDVYGFLLNEHLPPLSSFAPELGHYFTSTSKSMAPGLRVGYLAVPQDAQKTFSQVIRSTTWMATPLTAEIAANWIESGIGRQMAEQHRLEAMTRQKIARARLKKYKISGHPSGFHLWLRLPQGWSPEGFVYEARMRGLALSASTAFAVTRQKIDSIRLCLSTVPDQETLVRGLDIVCALLEHPGSESVDVV